jgi:hypothetical protein
LERQRRSGRGRGSSSAHLAWPRPGSAGEEGEKGKELSMPLDPPEVGLGSARRRSSSAAASSAGLAAADGAAMAAGTVDGAAAEVPEAPCGCV